MRSLVALINTYDLPEFKGDKFEVHVHKIEEVGGSFNLTGFNNVRFGKLSQKLDLLHLVIKRAYFLFLDVAVEIFPY